MGDLGGTSCATHAARLGAEVILIEKDIVGGAAHLLDCIPSKAMIATGGAMAEMKRATQMGLAQVDVTLDFKTLKARIDEIEDGLETSVTRLLSSQNVKMIEGTGRMLDAHTVEVERANGSTERLSADIIVLRFSSEHRESRAG